ncbi:MAG: Galactose-phosphate uridylyltransferase [Acidobacteria bacterium]|nr:Galactose-phosphate uridylyltransferase [Acidobacteriota bacterium]
MNKRVLRKTDGRALILYGRQPIPADLPAPSPSAAPFAPNGHLRWHPLRGEWVAYATHRQNRTFLPPAAYNPLAPTTDPAVPTELPQGTYDVAVFENLFPTFTSGAHDPPSLTVATRESKGTCEVVVFTQQPDASLGALPLWHLEMIIEVWGDRYRELGARDDVAYVYAFENRGVEVGVTLQHPHGQIYAYPFVPPIPARALAQERAFFGATGGTLLERLVAEELATGRRVLYEGPDVAAFVPVCARYPYEVWIATKRRTASLADLTAAARADFARALKSVLLKYDGLWSRPFPYIMAIYQAPTDGGQYPEAHLHVEFYPAYRMPDRLKYLAGSEIGAGVFTADTDPDDKAAELKAVQVAL